MWYLSRILNYEFAIDADSQRPNAMTNDWTLCYSSECDAEDKAFEMEEWTSCEPSV